MSYQYTSLIESEYGLTGPLVFNQVHDGPDNNIYIVTDGKNNKYALRESKRVGKNVVFEIELLIVLAKAGFSSPEPLLTRSGSYFIVAGAIQLVLFTYIKGTQVNKLEPGHLDGDVIEIGAKKLGEFHRLTNGLRIAAIPTRTLFTEYDRFLKIDKEKLRQFKNYEIVFDQANNFYKDARSKIDSKNELYGIIHNDYRVQNLIFNGNDCFIIDFDWACYGPLLKDLGLAIAEWSMYTRSAGSSPEATERFIRAYNETAPHVVTYSEDLIFWICFACLSDTCTFLVDTIEGRYNDKIITDVDQCYMYRKFKYFYNELINKHD
jgi:Ser/Thr protein kinase RdoA (MazF antagonist)